MMLTLQELKGYMRIEHEDEDNFLLSLMSMSEQWVINATDKNADKTSELFKVAQMIMCLHMYENREASRHITGRSEGYPFHLQSILMQIQATSGDNS